MDKFRIDGPIDAGLELRALLNYNHISFVEEKNGMRFIFVDRGLKWETFCQPTDDSAVLIFGLYPFYVKSSGMVHKFCNYVNTQARYGSMFCENERLVFRTGADLFDIYSAYETIARALEYNAGVIVRFWVRASACAEKR